MLSNLDIASNTAPVTLDIPVNDNYVGPSCSFVEFFAMKQGLPKDKALLVCQMLEKILNRIILANQGELFKDNVKISLFHLDDVFRIIISNRGFPFFAGEEWLNTEFDRATQDGMQKIRQVFDSVEFKNHGRNGQTLTLGIQIKSEPKSPERIEAESREHKISFMPLEAGQVTELSRLFCSVYGYNYIREDVYFPERMKALIASGDLVSRVAVTDSGRLVAHVGMVKLNTNPSVYEIALGLSDPKFKIKGVFSKLFDQIIHVVQETPMEYCIFDFVTNHDYSQKIVSRYGSKEMALGLGCQFSDTQAKLEALGIGKDPKESDRYSLLIAVRPSKAFPFGKDVTLPVHLGEMFEFLLSNLGMTWIPAPRFFPLAREGAFTKWLQESQKAVYFDLHTPGFRAIKEIIREWRHLLRLHYKYAAIDIPLDLPGVGQAFDYLVEHGFFVSGFVPYHNSNRLAFRVQSLGVMRLNFDEIKIATKTGQILLEVVRTGYERSLTL
jgi:hypothetical protein